MESYSSVKWITSESSVLRTHDVQQVLLPVWNQPTNLISIFGRARQGKSFLMNCLAGETEIFRISNEKESCTQGIDVSNKFMSVGQFATVDGGRLDHKRREVDNTRVGFVDAEGQGDKDVSYDANLICPILLASKCVIFNWKGDLQKDAILNTLGIMCRAAQNVGAEFGSSHKFGHLHIVFRDWQAEGSTAEDTFEHLFNQESSSDSSTRNKIRRDLQEAFTSIRVWLLDAPTELVSDLKKKLTIDKTSTLFRGQIRALRAALVEQLVNPARFEESVLTGKVLYGVMPLMVQTLNHGEVVLPGAAYRAMLAEELRANRDHFQREVQTKVEELLRIVRECTKIAHGESDDDVGEFMSGEEASWLFDEEIGAIVCKYETQVNSILDTYDSLRKQELEAISGYQTQILAHFFSQWTNEVNKWVVLCRQAAEIRLARLIDDTMQKIPTLVFEGVKGTSHNDNVTSAMLLAAIIQEVWVKISACFGNKQPCFMEHTVYVDATETVKQKFEVSKANLWSRYKECNSVIARESIKSLTQKAGDKMLAAINSLPEIFFMKHFAGCPIDVFMMALNQEFHLLKDQIEQEIRCTLLKSDNANDISERIVQETASEVIAGLEQLINASLKGTAIEQYKSSREETFASIMKKAGEEFMFMLRELTETWERQEPDLSNVDPEIPYRGPTLKGITRDIQLCKVKCEQDMLALLVGWFCKSGSEYSALAGDLFDCPTTITLNTSVKQNIIENIMTDFQNQTSSSSPSLAIKFLVQLSEYLQTIATPFHEEAKGIIMSIENEYYTKQSTVLEAREQAAAQRRRHVKEEIDAAANSTTYTTNSTSNTFESANREPSARAGTYSNDSAVNEQRRRAMEWAARNLALPRSARSATTGNRKTAAFHFEAMKHKKSLEQQRRDAQEYARRVFGESVLRVEETFVQKANEGVAVTSTRGKSMIEQAKQAARYSHEQRLRQEAINAAHRAKDAANRKKRAKEFGTYNRFV